MQIRVSRKEPAQSACHVLIALCPSSERPPRALRSLDAALGNVISAFYDAKDFAGKADERLQLPARGAAARRVYLLGLGAERELTTESLRRAAGRAVDAAMKGGDASLALLLPPLRRIPAVAAGQALAEGAELGAYRFDKFRTKPEPAKPLETLELLAPDARAVNGLRQGIKVGQIVARATNFARDLSNEPGGSGTPEWLAEQARKAAREVGLRARIFDERELERRKMGGLLTVGRGSGHPPRMIVLEHNPRGGAKSRPALALVGKGITFDSGGISLKPAANMELMKHDMSGGAAVLGAMRAIAELRLPLHVVGIVAAAQNTPDAAAYLPGDVVTTASGTTIEVLNTDAEGRIVLADALHYASDLKPTAIVDLATLTGSCKATFGGLCCAVMGSDEKLIGRIRAAAERSHERAWPLPLWDEHRERVKSQVADLKNVGGPDAGASTAGAFLSHFAGEQPWAHLDIAGTEVTKNALPYCVQGATGFGVRLLVELLRAWR